MKNNKTIEINENTPLMFLAGPMFLELFLNILLNNVDTLMLSHYSEDAVGSVGNANQVMFLVIIMFNVIATATSVVVAQYLGAKQLEKMNMIYTLAMGVNLVFGIVLSTVLVCVAGPLLDLINIMPVMRANAILYIDIVGGGLFLQACYNVMLQILRCNGYSRVGMVISIVINVINIIGNYLFLYGPLKFLNLGVAGVAISTVAARVIALIIAVGFFYRRKIGRLSLKYLNPFPGPTLQSVPDGSSFICKQDGRELGICEGVLQLTDLICDGIFECVSHGYADNHRPPCRCRKRRPCVQACI